MVAVVETDADANTVFFCESNQFVNLLHGNPGGFFHDDVLARADGSGGNFRERGVDGGHNYRVHLQIGEGLFEIGDGASGLRELYEFLRTRQICVASNDEF